MDTRTKADKTEPVTDNLLEVGGVTNEQVRVHYRIIIINYN